MMMGEVGEVGEVNAPWPPLVRLLRPLATSPQIGEEWGVSYSACGTSCLWDCGGVCSQDCDGGAMIQS